MRRKAEKRRRRLRLLRQRASFDSDLRKSLGPDATSRMVKLNRNHARYFTRIKHMIMARYIEKFGAQESGEAAASAASAASAGVL